VIEEYHAVSMFFFPIRTVISKASYIFSILSHNLAPSFIITHLCWRFPTDTPLNFGRLILRAKGRIRPRRSAVPRRAV
jgi:hypothetical protein